MSPGKQIAWNPKKGRLLPSILKYKERKTPSNGRWDKGIDLPAAEEGRGTWWYTRKLVNIFLKILEARA